MLGEIEFVLLNTRWMYPWRTNHLFCCVHVPSSVPCQLCWLFDQSSLWGAGRSRNFILTTINANMLPAPFLTLFRELNVLPGIKVKEIFKMLLHYALGRHRRGGGDLSKALKLNAFCCLIYGVYYIELFLPLFGSQIQSIKSVSYQVITLHYTKAWRLVASSE